MAEKYDTTILRIKEENQPSLRLAKHFGFQEVSRDDGLIRLERKLWVAQSEH
jgi:RimJ/RimL family protein N-acetyltransferase